MLSIIAFFLIAVVINAETFALWAFFDILQFFAHQPLIAVSMPGQAVLFLSKLSATMRLNLFTIQQLIMRVLGLNSDTQTIPTLYYQSGYTSYKLIINLCVPLILFLVLLACILISPWLDKIANSILGKTNKK